MPAPSTETGMYKKAYPSSPAAEGGSERGRGDGGLNRQKAGNQRESEHWILRCLLGLLT